MPTSIWVTPGGNLKTLALRATKRAWNSLCDIAADVPEMVSGDADGMRQIILNLTGKRD